MMQRVVKYHRVVRTHRKLDLVEVRDTVVDRGQVFLFRLVSSDGYRNIGTRHAVHRSGQAESSNRPFQPSRAAPERKNSPEGGSPGSLVEVIQGIDLLGSGDPSVERSPAKRVSHPETRIVGNVVML